MKKLWLDLETTGTNYTKHGIVQIACLVEEGDNFLDLFTSYVQPFATDVVEESALAINGLSVEEFAAFPEPHACLQHLILMMDKYVNKYNPDDKFTLMGYNVGFDKAFLGAFFRKNNHQYFNSYFENKFVDTAALVRAARKHNLIKCADNKLESVVKVLGVDKVFTTYEAHDALNDILATRHVHDILTAKLGARV